MYTVVLMTLTLTVITQGYDYCPTGWIKHKQTCYIVTDTVKGNTGESACAAIGGQLARVYSQEINNMVSVLRKDQSVTFINRESTETGYSNYIDVDWQATITRTCLEMRHDGKWQPERCAVAEPRKAACEKPVKEHIQIDVETALVCDRN